jgi:hypothetical protein
MIFRNVDRLSPEHTALHPPLWEPQIQHNRSGTKYVTQGKWNYCSLISQTMKSFKSARLIHMVRRIIQLDWSN